MSNYVKVGGVWKTVTSVHLKNDGIWKTAREVFIRDGGAWKRSLGNILELAFDPPSEPSGHYEDLEILASVPDNTYDLVIATMLAGDYVSTDQAIPALKTGTAANTQ